MIILAVIEKLSTKIVFLIKVASPEVVSCNFIKLTTLFSTLKKKTFTCPKPSNLSWKSLSRGVLFLYSHLWRYWYVLNRIGNVMDSKWLEHIHLGFILLCGSTINLLAKKHLHRFGPNKAQNTAPTQTCCWCSLLA